MKRIKIGILGCGNIAENIHIPNIYNIAEFEISAICDISEERLDIVGKKFDIPENRRFSKIDEFLNQNINAVIICTPTDNHYESTKIILENGKHVFVEKPLCKTSIEARELIKLASKNNLILSIGHFYNFFPQHKLAKKKLSKIGKIKLVKMVGETLIIKLEDGALLDYTSHFIHLLLWYFDYPDYEWIFSELIYENNNEEDTHLLIKLHNGILATITVLYLPQLKNWDIMERYIEFIGKKGKIKANFTTPSINLYISNTIISRARGYYQITPTFALHPDVPVSQTSYRKELEDFRDAILHKKSPEIDGVKALKVLEIIEAAKKSFKLKRKVYKNESFS